MARNAAEGFYLLQTVSIVSTGSRKDHAKSFAARAGWSLIALDRNNLTQLQR